MNASVTPLRVTAAVTADRWQADLLRLLVNTEGLTQGDLRQAGAAYRAETGHAANGRIGEYLNWLETNGWIEQEKPCKHCPTCRCHARQRVTVTDRATLRRLLAFKNGPPSPPATAVRPSMPADGKARVT